MSANWCCKQRGTILLATNCFLSLTIVRIANPGFPTSSQKAAIEPKDLRQQTLHRLYRSILVAVSVRAGRVGPLLPLSRALCFSSLFLGVLCFSPLFLGSLHPGPNLECGLVF